MSVNLSLLGGAGWQFFTDNGAPLAGGLLYTYLAGTSTAATTYTTSAGNVPNSNPIVLNSAGRVQTEIWLTQGVSYKFVLKTSAFITIGTYDNIDGAADPADIYAALAASSGSSLVGFIQSGSGAVATTVQAKLRESVSVMDFGAVGDGVTDDTAAFILAMTASECIDLGSNSYAVSNLTVDGKKWFGHGASIVGDGALLIDVTNSYFEHIYFHNTTTRGKLITGRTDSSSLGTFYNCKFGKANEHIYQVGYCVGARFQNCEFGGIDSGGANSVSWLKGAAGYSRQFVNGVNTLTEINCYTHWNKRGLYIGKTSGVVNVIGGVFEYNGYYALLITAEAGQGSYGIRVNSWFENNGLTTWGPATYTENPIYLNADTGCAIDLTLAQCTFNSDASLNGITIDSTATSTIHVHQEGQNTITMTAPTTEIQRFTTNYEDNDNGVIGGTITPTALTVVGGTGITYDNKKFVRKGMLVLFQFEINPNGGTTASNGGTTVLDFTKLPAVSLVGSLSCWKNSDGTTTSGGSVVPLASSARLYLPTWSANSGLIKISGYYISIPS